MQSVTVSGSIAGSDYEIRVGFEDRTVTIMRPNSNAIAVCGHLRYEDGSCVCRILGHRGKDELLFQVLGIRMAVEIEPACAISLQRYERIYNGWGH